MNRLESILSLVNGKDARVLDVGCANHHAVEGLDDPIWVHGALKKHVRQLMGLELESSEVEVMREAGFTVVQGDITDRCLPARIGCKFDIVVAGEIIEHLMDFDGFQNISDLLESDGICVLTTPYAWNFYNMGSMALRGRLAVHEQHTVWFDEVVLTQMISRTPLRIREVVYTGWEKDQRGRFVSLLLHFLGLRKLASSGLLMVLEKK